MLLFGSSVQRATAAWSSFSPPPATADWPALVMSSSQGHEYSMESPITKAGFFTLGLTEGLSGRADVNRDGIIYIHELSYYATLRVGQLSGGEGARTLQPGDVYTFAFQAFVPPQMRIDDNRVERQYQNRLAGSYAGVVLATNDGGHDNSMKTNVVRQIELIKTVTPSEQMYGLPVTYTLVVSNAGPSGATSPWSKYRSEARPLRYDIRFCDQLAI